jgi:hypothetical protein
MSKTPFDIRENLLHLALTILTSKIEAERTRIEYDWSMKRESWSRKFDSSIGKTKEESPEFPALPFITTEEVIEEAKKLNDFISNRI